MRSCRNTAWADARPPQLRRPVTPDAEEARAALWAKGFQRSDVARDNEAIAEVIAPTVVLTPRILAELMDTTEAGARRHAQIMRDEGRLEFIAPGQWLIP